MILLFDWYKADILGLFFFLFREAIMFHSSYVGELCLERSLEIAFASFSFLFVKACCLDFGFWFFLGGGGNVGVFRLFLCFESECRSYIIKLL